MTAEVHRNAREFLRRVVSHHVQKVIVGSAGLGGSAESALDDQGSDWIAVDSVPEWDALGPELPVAFPILRLRERIAKGCFVLLLYRPGESGPARRFIGYRLCERGIFSAMGRRVRISPDFVFIHHAEVLPEFRGRRFAMMLVECSLRDAYRRGAVWVGGVVSTSNAASMVAHLREHPRTPITIIATVHRFNCFGGRLVLRTPWRTIERALKRLG